MAQIQAPYTDGAATIAADGTIVTVTGILDDTNCIEGDSFRDPATGYTTPILERVDATHFTVPPYKGAALTGADYEIYPYSTLRVSAGRNTATVNTLITRLKDKGIAWALPAGFADPTAAGWGADENQYVRQDSTGKWWQMQSGTWAPVSSPYGLDAGNALSEITALSKQANARLNIGAVGIVRAQYFTSSGTYTPNANLIAAMIDIIGAGGGGGGVAGSSSYAMAAGSGGSGGWTRICRSAATIGSSQAVTIGAGGAAASAGNNTGGTGGFSQFGSLAYANGGGGGGGVDASGGSPFASYGAAADVGGGAGGSLLVVPGRSGKSGFLVPIAAAALAWSPGGADSIFGNGAPPSINSDGKDGNFGGGGSGACDLGIGSNRAGGAGGPGFILVTEFCSS